MSQCPKELHTGLFIYYCQLDKGHAGECENIVPFGKITAYNAFADGQERQLKEYAKALRGKGG